MPEEVAGASQETIRIAVADYPRPISAAVSQIEKHFGWVVTYEDTRYVHPSDIVDITQETRRDGNMSKRVFGRRNASIDLTVRPRPGAIETQVGEVLQELLAQSNAAGDVGQFHVERVTGGYHVVPIAIKGKSGVMEPYASPLDTRITLPYKEENALELIHRLATVVTAQSGFTVSPGTMPLNRLLQAQVSVNAENEVARDVLWRALQSVGPDLSWQLLCDVGERGMCAINIHPVRKSR